MKTSLVNTKQTDVIVVGSGFGGAITASRLVEAGLQVTLIERGPWRDTLPVRSAGISRRQPLPRTGGLLSILRSINARLLGKNGIRLNKSGLLEIWVGDGIKSICASGVGGGSHVWAGGMQRSEAGYWDGHASALSDEVMEPHYDRVLADLRGVKPSDFGDVPNHSEHAWKGRGFFTTLQPGEQPPVGVLFPEEPSDRTPRKDDTGVVRQPVDYQESNGMFGSPNGSKSTVDALLLLPALNKGLQVLDMHEVCNVAKRADGSYHLEVRDLHSGRDIVLASERVVFAAGTVNTNRLLLKASDAGKINPMTRLGEGLSPNGDIVGSWQVPDADERDTTLGTPSLGRVKIHGHEDSCYIVLGAGEVPPVPGWLESMVHRAAAKKIAVVAMAKDAANGRLWMERGQLKMRFSMADSPSYKGSMAALDALAEQSGSPVSYDRNSVLTAHPMGGCCIAEAPSRGVVNGVGEVHANPGLYVADAAAFPQPLGLPPSLSIAAWASHVAQHLIQAKSV